MSRVVLALLLVVAHDLREVKLELFFEDLVFLTLVEVERADDTQKDKEGVDTLVSQDIHALGVV